MNTKRRFFHGAALSAPIALVALLGGSPAAADESRAMDPIQPDPAVSSRTTRSAPDSARPAPETTALMKELDTNHDQFISRDEARADSRVERVFSSADADDDGRLSSTELSEGFRG
jgi:hypothetical protein